MAAPDQRIADVAVAKAAAAQAAQRKAAGGAPKPHSHGNVMLTAATVITLGLAIWAG
jgi:hypothetical protein